MPTEALCVALASCFCLAVAHVARRDGVEVADLRVHARAERAGRELRYGRIVVTTSADVPKLERRSPSSAPAACGPGVQTSPCQRRTRGSDGQRVAGLTTILQV